MSTIEMQRLARVAKPVVDAALKILPRQMDTPEARVMMYAIGLQESEFIYRAQVLGGGGKGPARGFWQFEERGGVRGVIHHDASRFWVAEACKRFGVEMATRPLWLTIEHQDVLAAVCARLLLFTDPKRLPALGDVRSAEACYLWNWRPGTPRPAHWPGNYKTALDFVTNKGGV
jgi:hypothetical protein